MNHPNEDVKHQDVVDWATVEWKKRTGEVLRDPDRAIRNLYEEGFLKKVRKGVYRYDPEDVEKRELEDFTPAQKEEILRRGNYRCAVCGKGREEGVELHIDHIKPKSLGGKATIENGQILCSEHNFRKKNYNQTESAKRMFMNLHKLANSLNDEKTKKFCEEILEVYEKHHVNGHIEWGK